MKSTADTGPVFLTTAETAELLRMSKRTLEGLRRNGEGPPFVRLGSHRNSRVVYHLSDVLLWLEDNRHKQVIPRPKNIKTASGKYEALLSSSVPLAALAPSGSSHLILLADAETAESGEDEPWFTQWLAQTEEFSEARS